MERLRAIPASALVLGLAGVIPFVWGAATVLSEPLSARGIAWFGPRFVGPYVQIFYGAVILSFMSGVLWGFATKAKEGQARGYALSVIPALWVFFTTGGGAEGAATNLMIGFVGLLALDYLFWRWSLAPPWWMALRILLTTLVVLCLSVVVLN